MTGSGPSRLTAVVYARVASRHPHDRRAVERQLLNCRRAAKRAGAGVQFEASDVGSSGNTTERDGLQKLFDYVGTHEVDLVICEDGTRLARSGQVWQQVADRLTQHGARLLYACDQDVSAVSGQVEAEVASS